MNIKQLKAKIKNRKPMSEKKKTFLKGLLFGFLAGGLVTITAVGVVGCTMAKDNAKADEPTQKALAPRNILQDFVINAGTYVFNETISVTAFTTDTYYDFDFTCNGVAYNRFHFWYAAPSGGGGDLKAAPFVGARASSNQLFYVRNEPYHQYLAYQYDGGWQDVNYRTINVTTSFNSSSTLYDWFNANATYYGSEPPASSSSSEPPASSSSSESGGASSSVENSTIEEVSKSFALQFSETNPFSAWAINPSNQEPAANYDSAAPWLLYTGNPSSSTMGSVTAEYRTYSVGSFYIDGNPAQTFDAIAITTLTLSPDNSFVVGGASEAQLVGEDAYNKGAFIVAKAFYLNTAAQTRVQVMDFATTSAKLGNEQVNALTGPAWLNVGFRNIVYVGENPNLEINGYTAPAAWWLKNNALSSSAAVATMLLGNAETGVFGLLASAFSGIGGILGIAIIPGLTIGTLLFIPLVVIVIFAIIKILNK